MSAEKFNATKPIAYITMTEEDLLQAVYNTLSQKNTSNFDLGEGNSIYTLSKLFAHVLMKDNYLAELFIKYSQGIKDVIYPPIGQKILIHPDKIPSWYYNRDKTLANNDISMDGFIKGTIKSIDIYKREGISINYKSIDDDSNITMKDINLSIDDIIIETPVKDDVQEGGFGKLTESVKPRSNYLPVSDRDLNF